MGKRKTKHHGTPRRKHIPQPILPAEESERTTAVCCSCERRFFVDEIRGTWLDRHCPYCGDVLSSAAYDAAACSVREQRKTLIRHMQQVEETIADIESLIVRYGSWWQKPLRWLNRRKMRKVLAEKADLHQKLEITKQRFNSLRFARYHTSEWYLSTRTPLQRRSANKDDYRMDPCYTKEGDFFLRVADGSAAAGISAEFEAFETLLAYTADSPSPLYGARLLPNLYLPCNIDSSHKRIWDQVDLLLLTRKCAFVIEVKRWGKEIWAPRPFDAVFVRRSADDDNEDASWALDQNAEHALRFSELCGQYPYESIYEVLLFVRPRSFVSDAKEFCGNMYVGCIPEGSGEIVRVFGDIVSRETLKVSEQELEDLADQMLHRFGDLNQKRAGIHVKRIEDLRAEGCLR